MITVYTKNDCAQCDATKKLLDTKQVEYKTVNLTENPDALVDIATLGYRQVPVVVTEEKHWSGFRPDLITGLV